MKAKFIGSTIEQVRWGTNDDPDTILVIGEEYDLANIEVHSSHTKLTLTRWPTLKFNSVSFELDDDARTTFDKLVSTWSR